MFRAARRRLDRYRLKDLLKVYRSRDDLIRAFPEVVRGEMTGLLRWAIRSGVGIDSSRPVLEPHIQTYRKILLRSRDEIVRRSRLRLQRYMRGIGIDVGPLQLPFPTGRNYELLTTDVLSPRRLYEHYSEFLPEELTIPDILCEVEGFLPFRTESLDFVILSHLLEHLSDPIGAVKNMIRVCKPGGVLVMAVPDREKNIDVNRPPTAIQHLLDDYYADPVQRLARDDQHYLEWAEFVEKKAGPEIRAKATQLEMMRYSIHRHVFDRENWNAFLSVMTENLSFPMKVEESVDDTVREELVAVMRRL